MQIMSIIIIPVIVLICTTISITHILSDPYSISTELLLIVSGIIAICTIAWIISLIITEQREENEKSTNNPKNT